MTKGILLGILLQCISATGYLVIVNVASIKSELFRTSLMILFASIVAIIFLVYSVKSGQQNLTDIQPKDYLIIGVGSIMVMFVAQLIFFFGVDEANMTTMAYTMLAFPIISLILELIVGRVKLTSLGIYDLIGFVLMVAGYVVFVSKPVTQ
jgi:drug/metabolite transporter (DMT)-like permease